MYKDLCYTKMKEKYFFLQNTIRTDGTHKPERSTEMDDKQKKNEQTKADKPEPSDKTWVDDMKQDLEDYIEEQGIYIRQ